MVTSVKVELCTGMSCHMSKNSPALIITSPPDIPLGSFLLTPLDLATAVTQTTHKMARNILTAKNIISARTDSTSQMAKVAQSSKRSITNIRKNLRLSRRPLVSLVDNQVSPL